MQMKFTTLELNMRKFQLHMNTTTIYEDFSFIY